MRQKEEGKKLHEGRQRQVKEKKRKDHPPQPMSIYHQKYFFWKTKVRASSVCRYMPSTSSQKQLARILNWKKATADLQDVCGTTTTKTTSLRLVCGARLCGVVVMVAVY